MSVGVVNKQTGDRIPTAGMPAVDSVLSGSSTNPVQNRVVKAALDEKADTDLVASDFDATASYTAGNYCIYEGKFYRFKNNHSGAWSASDVDEIQIAGELSSIKSGLTNVNSGYLSKQFVGINGTSIYDFVRDTDTPTGYIVADVQGATDNPMQNATSFAVIYKPLANGNYSLVKIEKSGQLFISNVLLPNDTAFTFTEFAKKSELTTFTGYVTSGKWYKIGEFRLNSFVWFLRYVIIACNGANIKCFKLRSTPTDGFNNSDNAVNQLIGTDQIGGLKYSADYKSISILLKGTATGNIQYSLLSQSGENRNVVLTEPVETDYVDSDIDIIN